MQSTYSVIYADPPWEYRNKNLRGTAHKHYAELKDQDLLDLPIKHLAAQNAALFLWVTFPKLTSGLSVLRAWGFSFKTVAFVWVKFNTRVNTLFTGTGFYTRANCEVCLLGTRGKLSRVSKKVHSVILARRQKHSHKPRVTRKRIEQLYGNVPRIELFATEQCEGWDSTGYEIDGVDIREYMFNRLYWQVSHKINMG